MSSPLPQSHLVRGSLGDLQASRPPAPRPPAPRRSSEFTASFALVGLALVSLVPAGCAPSEPTPSARSVLLFTVDTLRADHLASYGSELATPAHDRLAAESLVFDRAYSQATLTHPALTSLHTGLMPWRHGVLSQAGKPQASVVPLATLLQREGIATGSFVANLCKLQDVPGTVFAEGWDTSGCGMDHAREQAEWDTLVVDEALAWIAEQTGPWFCWIHLMDPHAEHRPPRDLWDWEADPPRETFEQYRHMNQWEERRELPPADELERLWALYAAEVRGVDRQLARVLDAVHELEARAPESRVAFVHSSDHGEELYETWPRYDHGFSLTEGVLWVPLSIRVPGLAPGRRAQPVETLQVTPTVLELLGLAAPYPLDGPSLLATEPSRGFAVSVSRDVSITLRTEDYRYWYRTTQGPWTRPPDEAPWRAEAPWFQRRVSLARYPEPGSGERVTAVQWLTPGTDEHQELARGFKHTLDRYLEHIALPAEERRIDDPEFDAELRALGYLGGDE